MRIFGDILPFLGFRRLNAEQSMEIGLDEPSKGFEWETFEVEWFGIGLVIFGKEVPQR